MATNMFEGGRPDPAHWTRVNAGMASPLWFPFLMAAGAGAAWWTYANWTRLAATSWAEAVRRQGEAATSQQAGESPVAEAAAPTPPAESTRSTLDENLAVQGEAPREATPPAAEPAPEPEADNDGLDVIDAAYAANLGPVPPPAKAGKKPKARKPKS